MKIQVHETKIKSGKLYLTGEVYRGYGETSSYVKIVKEVDDLFTNQHLELFEGEMGVEKNKVDIIGRVSTTSLLPTYDNHGEIKIMTTIEVEAFNKGDEE